LETSVLKTAKIACPEADLRIHQPGLSKNLVDSEAHARQAGQDGYTLTAQPEAPTSWVGTRADSSEPARQESLAVFGKCLT